MEEGCGLCEGAARLAAASAGRIASTGACVAFLASGLAARRYNAASGWAARAPILTQSRIDVPRNRSRVTAGHTPIAGVAWAPDRGVSKVEVRVDDGEWMPARLSAAISKSTWVQWLVDWDATPGAHAIDVRATDGTGETQTDQRTPPAPDGARGYHRVTVTVG